MPVDGAVILGGARTPIGGYGGALSRIRTDDLLSLPLSAACERASVKPRRCRDDRLNPNGGAVALGPPFGDSGPRCVLTLATELVERDLRYDCLGICVGSGQGVAIVLGRA